MRNCLIWLLLLTDVCSFSNSIYVLFVLSFVLFVFCLLLVHFLFFFSFFISFCAFLSLGFFVCACGRGGV